MTRPPLQNWLIGFAAIVGLLSVLPFRERVLLPVPVGTEQGFLAQEIGNQGTSNIVSNTISDSAAVSPVDTVASAGARRLIPAQIRGAVVPGTTTLANVLGADGSANPNVPGGLGQIPGTGAAAASTANGGDGGGANLTTGPGGNAPPGQVDQAQNVNGPSSPALLAGAAGQLLAAVVPEPQTWVMFITGIMMIGAALRRSRRPGRARHLRLTLLRS